MVWFPAVLRAEKLKARRYADAALVNGRLEGSDRLPGSALFGEVLQSGIWIGITRTSTAGCHRIRAGNAAADLSAGHQMGSVAVAGRDPAGVLLWVPKTYVTWADTLRTRGRLGSC